ncbi:unnamed protein product [Ciceribacter sp. T2.26MG-112.2]|nr:unnamed protein product [Ciceribacter naphthalenivorans]
MQSHVGANACFDLSAGRGEGAGHRQDKPNLDRVLRQCRPRSQHRKQSAGDENSSRNHVYSSRLSHPAPRRRIRCSANVSRHSQDEILSHENRMLEFMYT